MVAENPRSVFNLEDDVAAFTIMVANDSRTLNKSVTCRPPGNIISQSELVSLWEKKTGTTLKRVFVSESELIKLSETLPHPDNAPVCVLHNVFVKGDQTNYEVGEEALEQVWEIYIGIIARHNILSVIKKQESNRDLRRNHRYRAEEISIAVSSMVSPPLCTGEASQDPVIEIVSLSMVSHPQSIREASQTRYGHNVDPFKYVFKKAPKSNKERKAKRLAPRSSDEPRTTLKRLDFDDPPQV
ncbi:hypothetical protein SUGI_0705350 [Cryptomeria japonica]|nr:hypothetical protein SUGI_0705350 [Cryptomeria japonica]